MPRSKRNKSVSLTATSKIPSRVKNERLYSQVQECAQTYPHVFVFKVDNMRNTYLKDVRNELVDSRLFFGKTKVMAKALGTAPETELRPGLSDLARCLSGSVGLIFSTRSPTSLIDYFAHFSRGDFARQGSLATETVVVPAGVVYATGGLLSEDDDTPLPHSIETLVRAQGMPTRLRQGKVFLEQDFTVCEGGKPLSSTQAALLKLFGREMAEFKVDVTAWWEEGVGTQIT